MSFFLFTRIQEAPLESVLEIAGDCDSDIIKLNSHTTYIVFCIRSTIFLKICEGKGSFLEYCVVYLRARIITLRWANCAQSIRGRELIEEIRYGSARAVNQV